MKPRIQQVVVLIALLALCVAFHAITLTRYPAIWLDEAIFTDPAVKLVSGIGLKSTAWYYQDDQEIWAANVPLYTILLACWIQLFGLSPVSVRGFNLALACVSVALLLLLVHRKRWVTSTPWLIWLGAVLLMGYGMTIAIRSGRYDCLGILVCVALLCAVNLSRVPRRLFLVALGIIIPWAGLHVAVYVSLMAFGWLVWQRGRPWIELLLLLTSVGLGIISLFGWLDHMGALDALLYNVRIGGYAGKKDGPRDLSLILLLLALIVTLMLRAERRSIRNNSVALGWLAGGIVVPSAIFIVARLPVYYSWMAVIPLAIGLAMVMSRCSFDNNSGRRSRAVNWLLCCAILTGLPLQTAITIGVWSQRDVHSLNAFSERAGLAGNIVVVDPELFYSAQRRAAKVYFSMYDFDLSTLSRAQRGAVTVMIVSPNTQPALAKKLGGKWEAGESYSPKNPRAYRWLASRVSHSLFGGYDLQVFRRVSID